MTYVVPTQPADAASRLHPPPAQTEYPTPTPSLHPQTDFSGFSALPLPHPLPLSAPYHRTAVTLLQRLDLAVHPPLAHLRRHALLVVFF
ncbi:hypothetical protein B0H34DRAFT_739093, partial [Crassisporium funariophilum]